MACRGHVPARGKKGVDSVADSLYSEEPPMSSVCVEEVNR